MKVFDGHCDTILQCYLNGGGLRARNGHLDLERTESFERYAQFFAIFGAAEDFPGRDLRGENLWAVFLEQEAIFRREMERNRDCVVHCRTGVRSKRAAEKLVALGYQNVYDFGGIVDWPYETESGEAE